MTDPANYSVEIDRINKAEWLQLLGRFEDATIYQTWSYGAVRWGDEKLSHLVLKKGDEVVGLSQAVIESVSFIRTGIAYVPWGPLWRLKGKGTSKENLRQLAMALKREYAERRGLLVRITPHEIAGEPDEIKCVLSREGFKWRGSSYRTFLLDLTPSLDILRKSFDQKWRNQLNRAEKNGLKVSEGYDERLYEKFTLLYREMMARKQFFSLVDIKEFQAVQQDLCDPYKMRVFICEAAGEPVSAAIGSAIGDTGIYLLGASNENGLKAKGSYLLQWRMIQWLKNCGCHFYDLGGIDPEENPGVHHFKAGLGGKDVIHIGQFEFCTNPVSFFAVNFGDRVKNILRKVKGIEAKRKQSQNK